MTVFGVLTAVLAILPQNGTGGPPANLVLFIAANHLAGWLVCALVIGRLMQESETARSA